MAVPVSDLILAHPTNYFQDTDMVSNNTKEWVKDYPAISRLNVHSYPLDDGSVTADFDTAFFPESEDDTVRLREQAYPPNFRSHRLYSEEDGGIWFHTEISNIVLSAFGAYPPLVQTAHDPPKPPDSKVRFVDMAYTAQYGNRRVHVAVGEFKRNMIDADEWQAGRLGSNPQLRLSKELRGYAAAYECPLVFCFDHKTLLLLQFKAATASDLKRDCEVDCWVIPRDNPNGTTMRYALYRMLVQGFRRFQGLYRLQPGFPGSSAVTLDRQLFYNGLPLWLADGNRTSSPHGCTRRVDPVSGALYWVDADGNTLTDGNGNALWDTVAFWG